MVTMEEPPNFHWVKKSPRKNRMMKNICTKILNWKMIIRRVLLLIRMARPSRAAHSSQIGIGTLMQCRGCQPWQALRAGSSTGRSIRV